MKLTKLLFAPFIVAKILYNKLYINLYVKPSMLKHGKRVYIDYNFIGTYKQMEVGHDVFIGPNCVFYCSMAKISIGNYVMISPNVTIITGSHKTNTIGKYMVENTEQDKINDGIEKYDKPVVIEDDVWIGANVLILKGVTIGKGSIIHAGQVITKNVEPYTIYVNEKIKIRRFSNEEIIAHEKELKERVWKKKKNK